MTEPKILFSEPFGDKDWVEVPPGAKQALLMLNHLGE